MGRNKKACRNRFTQNRHIYKANIPQRKINVIDLNEVTPVMNALRIIGNNINQIAKKANEINSIYAGDIEDLKENYEDICHTLNLFLSTLPSTAA